MRSSLEANEYGQFMCQSSRVQATSFKTLPESTEELIFFYQDMRILPVEFGGCELELMSDNEYYGDRLNDNLTFKKVACPTHMTRYMSIRPILGYQDNLSMLQVHSILLEICEGISHSQIANGQGWVYISASKGKRAQIKSITRLRRRFQKIVAWSEQHRLSSTKLGGIVEADAFEIKRLRKSGLGAYYTNKCYVQFLGERNGDIVLEVFPNPSGGPERLIHVAPVLDSHLDDGSILMTDSATAYSGYVLDHPEKNLMHCQIKHAEAKLHGFTWMLYLDEEDGDQFVSAGADYTILEVSTEKADGYASMLKKFCRRNGGVKRSLMQAYTKEKQWRTNHADKDLIMYFLRCWGDVETALRDDFAKTIKELDECIKWDWEAYEGGREEKVDPSWTCPGCDFIAKGKTWAQKKAYHKKRCRYYNLLPNGQNYEHMSSRCCCCVVYKGMKLKATRAEKMIKKLKARKSKKKNIQLWECPGCSRKYTNNASSRWQHKQRCIQFQSTSQ